MTDDGEKHDEGLSEEKPSGILSSENSLGAEEDASSKDDSDTDEGLSEDKPSGILSSENSLGAEEDASTKDDSEPVEGLSEEKPSGILSSENSLGAKEDASSKDDSDHDDPEQATTDGSRSLSTSSPDQSAALIGIVVESWRFSRVFLSVLEKLDAGEKSRHLSQLLWFVRQLEEYLEADGLRIINIEGHPYDPGMPAQPINLSEFGDQDNLYVERMLEPIIMGSIGLVRTGVVTLRKDVA